MEIQKIRNQLASWLYENRGNYVSEEWNMPIKRLRKFAIQFKDNPVLSAFFSTNSFNNWPTRSK